MLRIENQAIVFALLCKYTVETEGEKGREVIQKGMIRYGRERGARMAARAKANGDPIALWTNQPTASGSRITRDRWSSDTTRRNDPEELHQQMRMV